MLFIAERSLRRSTEEALKYANRALELAYRENMDSSLVQAYDILGKCHYFNGAIYQAIDCYEKGLNIAYERGDQRQIAVLQNGLGVAFNKKGEFEKALEHFYKSLEIMESSGNDRMAASIRSNIGALHKEMKQYDDAIDNYSKALAVMQRYKDRRGISHVYNNLGDVYSETNDYEKAISFYRNSLSLKLELGFSRSAINTLSNMGRLFLAEVMYDSAEVYFDRALAMAQSEKNPYLIQKIYEGKSEIYLAKGAYAQARISYEKSLEIAQLNGERPEVAELSKKLAEVYALLGNYEKAYQHEKLHAELRDSIYTEESQRQVADMQARRKLQEKEAEIKNLQQDEAFTRLKLTFSILISIFFVLSFLALYVRFKEKKRSNVLLEDKNHAIRDTYALLERRTREISDQNDLLKQQTEEIHHQNELLKQSNSDLEQFAYVASHDLREPLRTIRSYMQLLQKRYEEKLDASAKEFIDYAVKGAFRMDQLLRDLLDYSRIGRTRLIVSPVPLDSLVEEVLHNLSRQIDDSNAVINVGKLPVVNGHESQLEQLFQNLLSNALKFSGNKPPEISISSETKDHEAVISITDNGIGIDDRYRDKIFTIFQRLHTQEKYQGTGIGLAICKRVVQQHGGELWFESEMGKGTTFYVSLPLTEPALETPKAGAIK